MKGMVQYFRLTLDRGGQSGKTFTDACKNRGGKKRTAPGKERFPCRKMGTELAQARFDNLPVLSPMCSA
jgi:hypothetical protein